jgi:hypothetical protein
LPSQTFRPKPCRPADCRCLPSGRQRCAAREGPRNGGLPALSCCASQDSAAGRLPELNHLIGRASWVGDAEAGVDGVQPTTEIVDRRRHAEVRVRQPREHCPRSEVARKRDHGDGVLLVLDDVQRLAGEQDSVAVRDTLAAERDLLRSPCGGIDPVEPAVDRLDGDKRLAVRRRVDAVEVERVWDVNVVAAQLDRLRVTERATVADRD